VQPLHIKATGHTEYGQELTNTEENWFVFLFKIDSLLTFSLLNLCGMMKAEDKKTALQ
jgi:hypothetical protein